ncbi:MAG: hypothetical protein HQ494_09610 [Rhodospirillales bacterium]|nr:hypothetical protein [Rhodospirillales bacterium]
MIQGRRQMKMARRQAARRFSWFGIRMDGISVVVMGMGGLIGGVRGLVRFRRMAMRHRSHPNGEDEQEDWA